MRVAFTSLVHHHIPDVALDALLVAISLSLAWAARALAVPLRSGHDLAFGALAIAVFCATNHAFRLYQRLWRYAAAGEVVVIVGAVATGTLLLLLADLAWGRIRPVPISVLLLNGLFTFVGFVGVRYRRRVWTGLRWRWRALQGDLPKARLRVLIVGAGEAGQLLAWRLLNQEQGQGYQLVGFVDDAPEKVGMRVHGLPVLGDRQAIPSLVAQQRVDLIVIAIYNIGGLDFRALLEICECTAARVQVLPNIFDHIRGTKGVQPIRDVELEDLLGRHPVEIDYSACAGILCGKRVLVTGAAGSIGSELCRQVAAFKPARLLVLDNNESGLHDLSLELRAQHPTVECYRLVGDVTNRPKLEAIFDAHRPDVVFHAAAYKHVPLMEEHPDEAVRVNVRGTLNVVDLACRHDAERFVLISSDKAVSPSSVMGATKRICELLIACLNSERTLCTGVRFGNVLGSRGSVVPTFERQIVRGEAVTITDPAMTRYFMSIPEAVSLVIQAATATRGGDLYVLDMGEQVRIEELAERLIRLRGLRPRIDVPIVYTGIRPGEKLHEELTDDGERKEATGHPSIFRVCGRHYMERAVLLRQVGELLHLAETQRNGAITAKLWEIVDASAQTVRAGTHAGGN